MKNLLLTGGRVIDPANQLDGVGDVLILDGKVKLVGGAAREQAPPGIRP